MLPLTDFLAQAKSLSRGEFVSVHSGYFLVKRPRKGASLAPEPTFGFATVTAKVEFDPFASSWQIAAVEKRPGNPFPERLTVGRATNCDIVLRVPFVSKVHAHILKDPVGELRLRDNRPSNATFHNHRKLGPGATRPLAVGDMVGFGSLEFELVDGSRLYEILTHEISEHSVCPKPGGDAER